MIEPARIYFIVFGVFSILGGLIGFYKARSRASLIAGGVSGALLLAAAWLLPARPVAGLVMGLVVSLMLAGRFTPAFMKKGGLMPNGMMALLGWGGVVMAAAALLKR